MSLQWKKSKNAILDYLGYIRRIKKAPSAMSKGYNLQAIYGINTDLGI